MNKISRTGDNQASEQPAGPSSMTSPSVLQGARAGDATCWARLLALYGPLVYQWCRAARWPEHDAADLVQEVFQVVHNKLTDFRRDRPGDSFRGWLRTIAINKMRDRWRQMKRQANVRGGSTMLNHLRQLPDSSPRPPEQTIPVRNDTEINWLYHRALEVKLENSWSIPSAYPAVDASLKHFAYVTSQGELVVRDLGDGHERARFAGPGPADAIRISPAARYLAVPYATKHKYKSFSDLMRMATKVVQNLDVQMGKPTLFDLGLPSQRGLALYSIDDEAQPLWTNEFGLVLNAQDLTL